MFSGIVFAFGGAAASEALASQDLYNTEVPLAYVSFFYLTFSFFYSTQMFCNLVLTIVAGVVARFLFLGDAKGHLVVDDGVPGARTTGRYYSWHAFQVTITKLFGPVAFGSFLAATIMALKELGNSLQRQAARDSNPFLCLIGLCGVCILGCTIF